MIIPVKTQSGSYDIILENGALKSCEKNLLLSRKVLVVTDSGVPEKYAQTVAEQSGEAHIFSFSQGEASKNFDTYKSILTALCENEFTRLDCVVAVGGGVVGDMAGFAAATYMRGIDFYNIPTTVLSQVDSSIGGKTAIDFGGYKNTVGAFYQPKCVIIDFETLKTLPARQISNGLAESLKMSVTHDAELFGIFENGDPVKNLETVIERSLKIKRSVVEEDEKESGLRKVLNFGHTIGHAIESSAKTLYHGECVALGMLPMCSESVMRRILPVLSKLGLPSSTDVTAQDIISAVRHDKKTAGENISVVTSEKIGTFNIKTIKLTEFETKIKAVYGK